MAKLPHHQATGTHARLTSFSSHAPLSQADHQSSSDSTHKNHARSELHLYERESPGPIARCVRDRRRPLPPYGTQTIQSCTRHMQQLPAGGQGTLDLLSTKKGLPVDDTERLPGRAIAPA